MRNNSKRCVSFFYISSLYRVTSLSYLFFFTWKFSGSMCVATIVNLLSDTHSEHKQTFLSVLHPPNNLTFSRCVLFCFKHLWACLLHLKHFINNNLLLYPFTFNICFRCKHVSSFSYIGKDLIYKYRVLRLNTTKLSFKKVNNDNKLWCVIENMKVLS